MKLLKYFMKFLKYLKFLKFMKSFILRFLFYRFTELYRNIDSLAIKIAFFEVLLKINSEFKKKLCNLRSARIPNSQVWTLAGRKPFFE
jgi:hypothetical protein